MAFFIVLRFYSKTVISIIVDGVLLTNPPQHPKDEESRIDEDVLSYESSLEEIMDYYNASQTINADQDPHTVFESLENLLVKPLPKQSIKVGI